MSVYGEGFQRNKYNEAREIGLKRVVAIRLLEGNCEITQDTERKLSQPELVSRYHHRFTAARLSLTRL